MADPLSVAGLAAGVVSLGLQVYGGVQTYLDGLDARDDELEAATRKVTEMAMLLKRVDSLVIRLPGAHSTTVSIVESAVISCDTQLKTLGKMVADLMGPTSSSVGLRNRLRDRTRRYTFPFHRATLSLLEQRVQSVTGTLQTTLQVLNGEITLSLHENVSRLLAFLPPDVQGQSPQAVLQSTELVPRQQSGDILATRNSVQNSAMVYSSDCICRVLKPRQTWTRDQTKWGSFILSHDLFRSDTHHPGCPYFSAATTEQTRKLSLQYTGLARILNTALSFSVSIRRVSGGMDVGHNLAFYPRVDGNLAPAFRILNLTDDFIMNNSRPTKKECADVLDCCVHALLRLYRTKSISPRETDSEGSSVLHLLVYSLAYDTSYWSTGSTVAKAISDLMEIGVLPMSYNDHGETAVSLLMDGINSDFVAANEAVTQLLSKDAGSPISLQTKDGRDAYWDGGEAYWDGDERDFHDYFRSVPGLAESCNCGPLSQLVVAGDSVMVTRLLQSNPETLKEVNFASQTPLHLGIHNSECLKILVESCSPQLLNAVDRRKRTALNYAIYHGNTNAVRILVAASCSISRDILISPEDNREIINILLDGLKDHRDKLKILGIKHLPRYQIEKLQLHEDRTLDFHAFKISESLKAVGISIPDYLNPETVFSIYGVGILDTPRLDACWARKFYDIDVVEYGKTPILNTLGRFGFLSNHKLYAAQTWYVTHGADIWTPLCQRRAGKGNQTTDPLTPAHYLLAEIGRRGRISPEHIREMKKKFEWCLAVESGDDCCCPCCGHGCGPFNSFLRLFSFNLASGYRYKILLQPEIVSQEIADMIEKVQPVLSEDQCVDAIRTLTFDALGARHTCCCIPSGTNRQVIDGISEDEIEEIHEEQSDLLQTVDELVAELEPIFFQVEDGKDKPLGIADPSEFWIRHWLPRIRETLDILESYKMTNDEILEAEEVGVVWQGPEPPPMPLESCGWESEMTFEEFQEAVNKIVEEA